MTVGPSLADFLHRERVPAGLIDRLDYIASPGPAGSWPPRPGCCEHRDIGHCEGPGRQLIWPPGCAKLRRCSARIAPMRPLTASAVAKRISYSIFFGGRGTSSPRLAAPARADWLEGFRSHFEP